MEKGNIIRTASFNPRIRKYIFIYFALILLFSIIGIPFLIIWLVGVGQTISKRYFNSLECDLTQQALRFKKGLLFSVEKTIPLENIQDLTFIEGPLLKYFDLAILKVETAGNSSSNSSDMKLIGIKNALDFRNAVIAQREKLSERKQEGDGGDASSTTALLTEIRDTLKRIEAKD